MTNDDPRPPQPAPLPPPVPFSRPDAPPFAQQQYPHQNSYYTQPYYTSGPSWGAAPPQPPKRGKGRRALVGAGVLAAAAALVAGGFAVGRGVTTTDGSGSVAQQQPSIQQPDGSSGSSGSDDGSGSQQFPFPGGDSGGTGNGQSNGSSNPTATDTQQQGVVTIVSVLGYQNGESAGTGMILTSDGEILTNNHVISGATSITVTDETTGKSYRADVVGTDASDDVAVLKLHNASDLTTAEVGDASDVSDLGVGDTVTGVGNGGGTGTLTQASGKVTALEKSITATDESGQNAERLTGLIQTNAPIVAGDSGGPLYDADGDIVGIDTAASAQNGSNTASVAYAIPIDDAMKVVDQIESGVETSSVQIGLPAFIGVGISQTTTGGAGVTSVLDGGPADKAGITAGSVITAVGGKSVTSADSLKTRLGAYDPGERVTITWTDTSGATQSATVTLAEGPAA